MKYQWYLSSLSSSTSSFNGYSSTCLSSVGTLSEHTPLVLTDPIFIYLMFWSVGILCYSRKTSSRPQEQDVSSPIFSHVKFSEDGFLRTIGTRSLWTSLRVTCCQILHNFWMSYEQWFRPKTPLIRYRFRDGPVIDLLVYVLTYLYNSTILCRVPVTKSFTPGLGRRSRSGSLNNLYF